MPRAALCEKKGRRLYLAGRRIQIDAYLFLFLCIPVCKTGGRRGPAPSPPCAGDGGTVSEHIKVMNAAKRLNREQLSHLTAIMRDMAERKTDK